MRQCRSHNDILYDKRPIQIGLLELILFQVEKHYRKLNQYYLEILYKTMFVVAYYGLFRVGEITDSEHNIQARNVHAGRKCNKYLFVLLSSKTHTIRDRPQKVRINAQTRTSRDGRAVRFFCPIELLNEYSNLRGEYTTLNEPFFILPNRNPPTANMLREILKAMLTNLKLDPGWYGTHSFRSGRATDLLKEGYSIDEIKTRGRWKSDAVFDYLRD